MTCTCCDPRWQPLTEAETLLAMRAWLFAGNQATTNASGQFMLTAMNPGADSLAARMVLASYGLRRWHGIELNAAGRALWQQAHP